MKRTQGGMTLIGFIITLIVVMMFIYCGMKVVPMYTEYFSVKKALATIANDPGSATASKDQIRQTYGKQLYMSYVNDEVIRPDQLKIESTDSGYKLVVDYERRTQLIYNLDVVGKFHTEQLVTRGGTAAP